MIVPATSFSLIAEFFYGNTALPSPAKGAKITRTKTPEIKDSGAVKKARSAEDIEDAQKTVEQTAEPPA